MSKNDLERKPFITKEVEMTGYREEFERLSPKAQTMTRVYIDKLVARDDQGLRGKIDWFRSSKKADRLKRLEFNAEGIPHRLIYKFEMREEELIRELQLWHVGTRKEIEKYYNM